MDANQRSRPRSGDRIDEAVRTFREHGLAVTPQRLAIYRAVLASREHPSPEDLHRALRRTLPALSLATVYKALAALVRAGLVVDATSGKRLRVEANLRPHHHLVCERCGRISDLEAPAFETLPVPAATPGFTPSRVRVEVLGTCDGCARAAEDA